MKTVIRLLITIALICLPFAFLIWLFGDSFFLIPCYVFSGQLFASSWNRVHAGMVLDQPTIGKWYFWFTIVTVITLSYMAVLRRFFAKKTRLETGLFIISLTILCLFLSCLLTIPFYWLIQYIASMGWTAKRLYGLFYGIAGYIAVLGFYFWAVKIGSLQAYSAGMGENGETASL